MDPIGFFESLSKQFKSLSQPMQIVVAAGLLGLFILVASDRELVANLAHALQSCPPIIYFPIKWPEKGEGKRDDHS